MSLSYFALMSVIGRSSWRKIKHRWPRADLGMQREAAALLDQSRDLAHGIIEVAESAGHGGTIGDAGGRLAGAHAIAAEITFHHDIVLMTIGTRLLVRRHALWKVMLWLVVVITVGVRAGHHAGAAADAQVMIDVDDAIVPLEARPGRTGLDAGRILAVIAQYRERQLPHHRVLAFLLLEHAGVEYAGRGA